MEPPISVKLNPFSKAVRLWETLAIQSAIAYPLYPIITNYVYNKMTSNPDDDPIFRPIPEGIVLSLFFAISCWWWATVSIGSRYYEWILTKQLKGFRDARTPLSPQPPAYHLQMGIVPSSEKLEELWNRSRSLKTLSKKQQLIEWGRMKVSDHPYLTALLITSPFWLGPIKDSIKDMQLASSAIQDGLLPATKYYCGEALEKMGDPLVKTTVAGILLSYSTKKTRFRSKAGFHDWCRFTFAKKSVRLRPLKELKISDEMMVSLLPKKIFLDMENGKIKQGLEMLTWYYSRVPYLAFSHPQILEDLKSELSMSATPYAKEYKRHPEDHRLELLLLTYAGLYGYQDNYEAAWHFGQKLMKAPLDEEARMALLAHNAQLAALRSEEHLPEDSRQALLEWYRHVAARPGSRRERYTGTSSKVFFLDDPDSAVPTADNILLKKYRTLEEAVAERDLTASAVQAIQGRQNFTLQRILDVVPEEDGAVSLIATEHGKTLYDLIRMQGFLPEALLTDTLDYLVLLHERIPLEASKKGEWHLGRRLLDKLRAGGAALGAEERALFESLFHPQAEAYEQLRLRSLAVFPKAVGKDAHLLNWMLTSRGQICAIDFEDKGVLPAVYDLVNFIDYHRLDPLSKNLLLTHAFRHYAERRPGLARADFDRGYDFGKAHRNLELTLLWTEPESPGASDQSNRVRIYREGLEAAVQLREESTGRQAEREYLQRLVRAYEAVHALVPEV